jgi:hypothetical protein
MSGHLLLSVLMTLTAALFSWDMAWLGTSEHDIQASQFSRHSFS